MKLTENSIISYNSRYLTVDEKPWFPVMGEIHYSRIKREHWERELLKMKAGGVDVISTYVIWIHHEEIKGEWDFDGNRDLRAFLQTVNDCGLYMILRIGPWAHGEVRNGGFPDWLVQMENEGKCRLRTNDPEYLSYAQKFYEKIYEQTEGMLQKDGGPVIGIQIENEYGHCGGLQGEEGEQHMHTLLALAKEAGFDVPLYTATGWGGAVTGGMLPVMGGYCEAPWDQRTTEIEPSGNYLFTEERNDQNIGSDYGTGAGLTFEMKKFPYLTAELGGGLQVTRHRRPVASAKDIAVMSMVKLGSGCNLLGYYMYHGGTNPEGKLTTLQESRETGYPNDLPVLSYDFNAPIREYGQLTDTYRELRRLAMFVKDYEDRICRSVYIPQPGNPEKPDDFSSLRSAVRMYKDTKGDGEGIRSGFYFLNNYQRRYPMEEHTDFLPTAFDQTGKAEAVFDRCTIRDGDAFFRLFNLKLGEALLKTTNAVPLCILNRKAKVEQVHVFYVRDGEEPDYRIRGKLGETSILTLTDEEALHAYKAEIEDRDVLILSNGDLVPTAQGGLDLLLETGSEATPVLRTWPALPACPEGFRCRKSAARMTRTASSSIFAEYVYERTLTNTVKSRIIPSTENQAGLHGIIALSDSEKNESSGKKKDSCSLDEILLKISYAGESAELLKNGKRYADNFYTGQDWEIGVRDLLKEDTIVAELQIHPLTEEDRKHLYLQDWPEMQDQKACRIEKAETASIFRIPVWKDEKTHSSRS